MGFWGNLLRAVGGAFGGGGGFGAPTGVQTPGINPGANTPQAGQTASPTGTGGGFDWKELMPWIAGTGAKLGGDYLQGRAANQRNDRLDERTAMMDQLARDEMAKKEYYSSILLPSLMQGIGNRNPNMARMMYQRQQSLPGMNPSQGAPVGGAMQQEPQPGQPGYINPVYKKIFGPNFRPQ